MWAGCLCKSVAVGVILVAVLLGLGVKLLEQNEELRHKFFANFCYQVGVVHSVPALDNLRCGHLKSVTGPVVVEIGPGPGIIFYHLLFPLICLLRDKFYVLEGE